MSTITTITVFNNQSNRLKYLKLSIKLIESGSM
jgi:hypothetical protein